MTTEKKRKRRKIKREAVNMGIEKKEGCLLYRNSQPFHALVGLKRKTTLGLQLKQNTQATALHTLR